jgi:low temperature requirement protein LtrA
VTGAETAATRAETVPRPGFGVVITRGDHRVTQFELFFDLVFVFAFTQVTELMSHEHDGVGVVRGLTVLGILWWSWAPYTWLTNHADVSRGVLRAGLAIATGSVFVVAVMIPHAFGEQDGPRVGAIVLVACYLLVRAVHAVLYLIVAGSDRGLRRQIIVTNVSSLTPAFVLLFLGAWFGGALQTWLWILAWVVDLAIVFVTSWGGGSWQLHSVKHWAERYGLVVMLVIGESIVSIGAGLRDAPVDAVSVGAAFLAIAGAVLLWWVYFDRLMAGAEHALERRTGTERIVAANRAYTDLHYPVVAGLMLTALGIETVMAHIESVEPLGLFGAAALSGGVSLFLAATVFVWRLLTGRWLLARLILATLLLPGTALISAVPPLAALATAVTVGTALLIIERRSRVLSPRSV